MEDERRSSPATFEMATLLATRLGKSSNGTAVFMPLINNAGGQFSALAADISANGFDAVVRNNLLGGFLVSRACYDASFREHGGAVVNITADHERGIPLMSHSTRREGGHGEPHPHARN